MQTLYSIFLAILPFILVVILIISLFNLHGIAKKGSKVALAVGILFQMFVPDPKVQHTIEMVAKQKERAVVKSEQQGENDQD